MINLMNLALIWTIAFAFEVTFIREVVKDVEDAVYAAFSLEKAKLGEPLYRVRSCTGLATTNCAYGGPDNRFLYITESSSNTILRAEMPWPGKTMYSHMD